MTKAQIKIIQEIQSLQAILNAPNSHFGGNSKQIIKARIKKLTAKLNK